jgi:hypothetical protein
MSTTRTDVHAPVNLVTEDYDFVRCFDRVGPGECPATGDPFALANWRAAVDAHRAEYRILDALVQSSPLSERGLHQCHHCGAAIRYVAVLKHLPTGQHIAVGEQCLENRFERATGEFHALRKAAQLDREAQRIVKARNEWFEQDPARLEAFEYAVAKLDANDYSWSGIFDFVHKVRRYGTTSDKFVAAILRNKDRDAEYAVRKAEREAADAEVNWIPVPAGRYVIEGVVLSAKWKDSDFGANLKLLVQVDTAEGSFKVYGNAPRDFLRTSNWSEEQGTWFETNQVQAGDKVRFTATVEKAPWSDDEFFGSFKRPAKAVVVERKLDEVPASVA